MNTNAITVGISLLVLAALGIGVYMYSNRTDDAMMKSDGMTPGDVRMEKEDAMTEEKDGMQKEDAAMMKGEEKMMQEKGSYQDYSADKLALAAEGKVILYFHADWCPICRPLDAEFKSKGLPAGVHVLKVDYDNATELKRKYGVTYQHTFVQVDASGKELAQWGDSFTLAQVLSRVQ